MGEEYITVRVHSLVFWRGGSWWGETGGGRQRRWKGMWLGDNERNKRGFPTLILKGSFESTSEEPSEGAVKAGKSREGNAVNLEGYILCFLKKQMKSVPDACLASPGLLLVTIKKKKDKNHIFMKLYLPKLEKKTGLGVLFLLNL